MHLFCLLCLLVSITTCIVSVPSSSFVENGTEMNEVQETPRSPPALHTRLSACFAPPGDDGDDTGDVSPISRTRSPFRLLHTEHLRYKNKAFLRDMQTCMQHTALALEKFLFTYNSVDKSVRHVIATPAIKSDIHALNEAFKSFYATIDTDDEFNDKIIREFNDVASDRLSLLYMSLLFRQDVHNINSVDPYLDLSQKRFLKSKYRRLYSSLKPYIHVKG